MFLLPKKTIKALLSIADGRAASFFNTFIKIITPPPFLRAADFRVQRYEEKTRYGEKFREKQRISEKIGEKMAAYLSNPTDVVRCFTQFFRIFAYEKTRSMIPRDFRTEVWLVEGTPFPKHSRNIPETFPKQYRKIDRSLFLENSSIILPVLFRLFIEQESRMFHALLKSRPQQPRLCLKNCFYCTFKLLKSYGKSKFCA